FDHMQAMAAGHRGDLVHGAGLPEYMHRQDRTGTLRYGGRQLARIQVHRAFVDVDEHRPRAFVKDAIGRRDKAERARHHLVARSDFGRADDRMESGGPARDSDGKLRPDKGGESLLERPKIWTETEAPALQRVDHERNGAIRDLWLGHRHARRGKFTHFGRWKMPQGQNGFQGLRTANFTVTKWWIEQTMRPNNGPRGRMLKYQVRSAPCSAAAAHCAATRFPSAWVGCSTP